MLKGNKGEWSETYAFLKLMSDRAIAAADEDIRPIDGESYSFISISRGQTDFDMLQYDISKDDTIKIINHDGNTIKVIDSKHLKSKIVRIFEDIKQAKGASFQVPAAEDIMGELQMSKVKAPNTSKSDMTGIIMNSYANTTAELGFSIKSQLGGPSTLLNASSHTNFIYDVSGFTGDIDMINSIETTSKIRDRLSEVIRQSASIEFNGVSSEVFAHNLSHFDTTFDAIMARIVFNYYLGKASRVDELCDITSADLAGSLPVGILEYKLKSFLRAIALGMVPSKVWDTLLEAYGGYIIVLDDGSLVCYSLYNDDAFRNYLYRHTKLESPSSTRHNYGKLYRSEGKLLFNLNCQIRFIE